MNTLPPQYEHGTNALSRYANLIYQYLNATYGNRATIKRSSTRDIYPMMRYSFVVSIKTDSLTKCIRRLVEDMEEKFNHNIAIEDLSHDGKHSHYHLKLPSGSLLVELNHYGIEPKKRISILLT